MDLGLNGRCYLVTGASSGLGYAGAAALVADGARVLLAARDPGRVARAAGALGADGIAADLADPGSAELLVTAALERWGRLDGALISSGGPPPVGVEAAGDEQWRAAFESVFLGPLRLARTVAAATGRGAASADAVTGDAAATGHGAAIGLVLSSSVRAPIPGLAISNGFRPGLAMAAKTLADEVGPRGVRVFGLAPGRILTERTAQLDGGDPEVRARSAAAIPLRRLGDPEEFGRVAAFLLSPAASYITGSVVQVDGGSIRSL